MNLDIHILELRQGRVDHGIKGLAGGVGDQMQVEFLIHKERLYCPQRP
jgi:hypothetical protein